MTHLASQIYNDLGDYIMEFISKLIEIIEGIFGLSMEATNVYSSFSIKKKSRKSMRNYKTYCIDSEYQLVIIKLKNITILGRYFFLYLFVFLSVSIFINSFIVNKILTVLFKIVSKDILQHIIFGVTQL